MSPIAYACPIVIVLPSLRVFRASSHPYLTGNVLTGTYIMQSLGEDVKHHFRNGDGTHERPGLACTGSVNPR
ncbi:hypothetical protein K8P10_000319 [Leucobacter sp. Psy1]|nr:hypothetical protein K8P10_000319 [Leucobacter sp. Psy1]